MFQMSSKPKDDLADGDRGRAPDQEFRRAVMPSLADSERSPVPDRQVPRVVIPDPTATPQSRQAATTISAGMTVTGKIAGDGAITIFGRVEGELRATNVLISDSAEVDGDVTAEELIVGGHLKGTIHANRVRLNSTAVVEGDIFHRSLAVEENARFEGSSRREDKAIDMQARVQPIRPQFPAQSAPIELHQKSDGGFDDGGDAVLAPE